MERKSPRTGIPLSHYTLTPERAAYIRAHYQGHPGQRQQLADHFGISYGLMGRWLKSLGLTRKLSQKYHLTEEGRRAILSRYRPGAIKGLARELQAPTWRITRWAKELGLASRAVWSEREEALLRRSWGHKPLEWLEKHLGRSPLSIKSKAQKLGLSLRDEEALTLADVSAVLGVSYRFIQQWIDRGWLSGVRLSAVMAEHGGAGVWQIQPASLRRFIFSHPDQIDPRRMTPEGWLYLIDILSGNGLGPLGHEAGQHATERGA